MELGWSQEALAGAALSNSDRKGRISQVENARVSGLSRETVKALCGALHISANEIPASLRWAEAANALDTTRELLEDTSRQVEEIGREVNNISQTLVTSDSTEAKVGTVVSINDDDPAKRFLSHYLGQDGSAALFVGRRMEIDDLNQWVAKQDTPPNLLIEGAAGRGKSSLVVRWLDQLDYDPAAVLFMPISIRFETNRPELFYRHLAIRLAKIAGEEISLSTYDTTNFLIERSKELIKKIEEKRKKCLIVVDGLDEAVGWQIRPGVLAASSGSSVKILVTARPANEQSTVTDWQRQLGWSRLHSPYAIKKLDLLNSDDVSSADCKFLSNFCENAVDKETLAAFVLRANCDPILLSLILEDAIEYYGELNDRSLSKIGNQSGGLDQYLETWWLQQRDIIRLEGGSETDQTLLEILAILAVALEPLRLAELTQLMSLSFPGGEHVGLDVVRRLRRVVVGDGTNLGLSFSHPEFSRYFRERHFGGGAAVAAAQQGFIEWGKVVIGLQKKATYRSHQANTVPEYLIRNYSRHLEIERHSPSVAAEADELERLKNFGDLLQSSWKRASDRLEDGLRYFAEDVVRVCDCAKEFRHSDDSEIWLYSLELQLRGALILGHARAVQSVDPDLLIAGYHFDLVTQGQIINSILSHPDPSKGLSLLEKISDSITSEMRAEIISVLKVRVKGLSAPRSIYAAAIQLREYLTKAELLSVALSFEPKFGSFKDPCKDNALIMLGFHEALPETAKADLLAFVSQTPANSEDLNLIELRIAFARWQGGEEGEKILRDALRLILNYPETMVRGGFFKSILEAADPGLRPEFCTEILSAQHSGSFFNSHTISICRPYLDDTTIQLAERLASEIIDDEPHGSANLSLFKFREDKKRLETLRHLEKLPRADYNFINEAALADVALEINDELGSQLVSIALEESRRVDLSMFNLPCRAKLAAGLLEAELSLIVLRKILQSDEFRNHRTALRTFLEACPFPLTKKMIELVRAEVERMDDPQERSLCLGLLLAFLEVEERPAVLRMLTEANTRASVPPDVYVRVLEKIVPFLEEDLLLEVWPNDLDLERTRHVYTSIDTVLPSLPNKDQRVTAEICWSTMMNDKHVLSDGFTPNALKTIHKNWEAKEVRALVENAERELSAPRFIELILTLRPLDPELCHQYDNEYLINLIEDSPYRRMKLVALRRLLETTDLENGPELVKMALSLAKKYIEATPSSREVLACFPHFSKEDRLEVLFSCIDGLPRIECILVFFWLPELCFQLADVVPELPEIAGRSVAEVHEMFA